MKIAFMFPGQGAQSVGMGQDLYEKYEEVRNIYGIASEISGKDIAQISFNSTIEELSKTENTQLAIATMSLGILKILEKNNIKPEITVGLSLGEYPALISGGYLNVEDGIKLLKRRGYLMGTKVAPGNYSMAAVIGLDSTKIEEICKSISEKGMFIVPANYNYSGQTVISGEENAINLAMDILKENGAKRVLKLQTGGPFHTAKLNEAKELYKEELAKAKFNKENIKAQVIKNIDGTFYNKQDDMVDILSKHIVSPVRFDKAIKTMQDNDIDTYVEIGPGKTLTGFIKKENKESNVININSVESLENFIETINND
ncbi:MAG: ACP S-malonyltransferase [Clostridium sp.]|jgi:[acyl-carrier-protein] S-malonyltransferase|nr:ACP S-malonyltransferase [Clostridium sp.]